MWKYIILYNCPEGADFKAVQCEYVSAPDRATAASWLCREHGIPESDLIVVLEASPRVKITFAKDGSMFRFRT